MVPAESPASAPFVVLLLLKNSSVPSEESFFDFISKIVRGDSVFGNPIPTRDSLGKAVNTIGYSDPVFVLDLKSIIAIDPEDPIEREWEGV